MLQAAAETAGDNQVNSDTMDGVTLKQLAGGCLCCAAAGMLAPAIAMVTAPIYTCYQYMIMISVLLREIVLYHVQMSITLCDAEIDTKMLDFI